MTYLAIDALQSHSVVADIKEELMAIQPYQPDLSSKYRVHVHTAI